MDIGVPIKKLGQYEIETLQQAILSQPEEAWFNNQDRQNDYEVHQYTHSIVLVFTTGDGWPNIEVTQESGWDLLAEQAIPLMHEIEHAWGVFLSHVLPGHMTHSGPHWGIAAMHKRGMLAGFASAGVRCSSGQLGSSSCRQPLKWDFREGSVCCSHDSIGGYNRWDLLLMGLITPQEMSGEKLVFCEGPSKKWGRGVEDVTCTKIHTFSAWDIEHAPKLDLTPS